MTRSLQHFNVLTNISFTLSVLLSICKYVSTLHTYVIDNNEYRYMFSLSSILLMI